MKKEQVSRPWQVMKIRGVKAVVFRWIWDDILRFHVLEFLYWRYIVWFEDKPAPQVSAVRAYGFWSGFMSEARGRSWDRKSRYGKK